MNIAKKMFTNIGKKIKLLTQILCWIGIIACFLIGFIVIIYSLFQAIDRQNVDALPLGILAGVLVAVLGSLICWISSFMTYGFGELVDKTVSIENIIANGNTHASKNSQDEQKHIEPNQKIPGFSITPDDIMNIPKRNTEENN